MEAKWLGAITSAAVIILGRSLTTVFACVDSLNGYIFIL